jgi:hypothetical protein
MRTYRLSVFLVIALLSTAFGAAAKEVPPGEVVERYVGTGVLVNKGKGCAKEFDALFEVTSNGYIVLNRTYDDGKFESKLTLRLDGGFKQSYENDKEKFDLRGKITDHKSVIATMKFEKKERGACEFSIQAARQS